MVRAINDGGETQSIADFIILEPTPERRIEAVSVESVDEQKVRFKFYHNLRVSLALNYRERERNNCNAPQFVLIKHFFISFLSTNDETKKHSYQKPIYI